MNVGWLGEHGLDYELTGKLLLRSKSAHHK